MLILTGAHVTPAPAATKPVDPLQIGGHRIQLHSVAINSFPVKSFTFLTFAFSRLLSDVDRLNRATSPARSTRRFATGSNIRSFLDCVGIRLSYDYQVNIL